MAGVLTSTSCAKCHTEGRQGVMNVCSRSGLSHQAHPQQTATPSPLKVSSPVCVATKATDSH